ncbi:MAG TPA: DinB family protein [Thermoanaerobaculia bacterium]|nr:DinB family protein [Thermoanaerobaculia bacterium]
MSTGPVVPTALSRGRTERFGELAARYLEEYLAKLRLAFDRLPSERLWWRPAPGANSAGNLALHLCGNLSLWLLASVGGEPFVRDRAAEFAATGGPDAAELLFRLEAVVSRCAALVRGLGEDDLRRPLRIQTYDTDVLGAVFHAVEHMSYHTGQVLYLLKQSLPGGEQVELYPQHRRE